MKRFMVQTRKVGGTDQDWMPLDTGYLSLFESERDAQEFAREERLTGYEERVVPCWVSYDAPVIA